MLDAPERAAEAARPVVPGRRRRPARRRRSAAWPATTPAARARSPTATWCTTCSASTRWLADGSDAVAFGPVAALGAARAAAIARASCAALARSAQRDEIEARWPKVMRRVGGYNLDIFHPQSERPYTADGSVNLAHLLVGAEGTLALSRAALTLKLAPLPRAKVLGVVNFPTFHARDGRGAAHRQARPDRGRAGRPHDDRAGARQPGVPADDRERADRRADGDPAGRVQRRRPRGAAARGCSGWSS